jgi:hypothetical protein
MVFLQNGTMTSWKGWLSSQKMMLSIAFDRDAQKAARPSI